MRGSTWRKRYLTWKSLKAMMSSLVFQSNKGIMFIGADVNHPKSHDASGHSISGVASTINWPGANKYSARFRIQSHRKEHIVNLGEMCSELIKVYVQTNGFKPEKIFLFRDGVSESQFDMVVNQELVDVKRDVCSNGYLPAITHVVAQKRHQIRLFPASYDENVPTRTVVDTIIVELIHMTLIFIFAARMGYL